MLFTNNYVLNKFNSIIIIEHNKRIKEINIKNRFKVDKNINNNNSEYYKYDEFVIVQYPRRDDVSFAEGYINNIQNNYKIFHSINTKNKSSGSPCYTRNLKVI